MEKVRISDVAAHAGVSLGTVSNVLNHADRVRPATRRKVEEAIEELGYIRNGNARTLAAGRSDTLAYVCLDAGNPFFTDVARGAQAAAAEEGLVLLMCNSDGDAATEQSFLQYLQGQRVHGVLITAVDYTNPLLAALPRSGVPVVLVDRTTDERSWCSVGVDDVAGGAVAVRHLLDRGHERIAFVGGPLTIPQIADRLEGAREAVTTAGLGPEALTVLGTDAPNVEGGRDAAERLMGLPAESRPTALFCANDLIALGALQTLIQAGVAVPEEVSLVGYDDIYFAEAAAVPLSSVRQPRAELGRRAAALLLDEANRPGEHEHETVQFQAELVVRASSGAHRRA